MGSGTGARQGSMGAGAAQGRTGAHREWLSSNLGTTGIPVHLD